MRIFVKMTYARRELSLVVEASVCIFVLLGTFRYNTNLANFKSPVRVKSSGSCNIGRAIGDLDILAMIIQRFN